ncbi:hypothetical protein BDZ89DRAFT_414901 [Hymenopellis radicata]|nr:hypothetical protein BDZ89DRAFT_414901 [Hymenopellis radicata]
MVDLNLWMSSPFTHSEALTPSKVAGSSKPVKTSAEDDDKPFSDANLIVPATTLGKRDRSEPVRRTKATVPKKIASLPERKPETSNVTFQMQHLVDWVCNTMSQERTQAWTIADCGCGRRSVYCFQPVWPIVLSGGRIFDSPQQTMGRGTLLGNIYKGHILASLNTASSQLSTLTVRPGDNL